MNIIKAFSQTGIGQRANINKPNTQIKINFTSKSDIAEFSTKTPAKNKTEKHTALALALIGTISANTAKKSKLLEAKKAQKYAQKVQVQAEKLKGEVSELFNNGGIKDGRVVANVFQGDCFEIMEEFTQDGSLSRRSGFINKTLSSCEVLTNEGKDFYEFDNGALAAFKKGRVFENGKSKAAEQFYFEDGELVQYEKDVEVFSDEVGKAAKQLMFKDGKLIQYGKDIEFSIFGTWMMKNGLIFEDGKLVRYEKDVISDAGEGTKTAKCVFFKEGKLSKYLEGYEETFEGSKKAELCLHKTDGRWKLEHNCNID